MAKLNEILKTIIRYLKNKLILASVKYILKLKLEIEIGNKDREDSSL